MKIRTAISFLIIFLSFSLLIASSVAADWWERGERPVYPRETEVPTIAPTSPPPPSVSSAPGNSNEDPCAPGKSYTGDYCGWSPRIGGDDPGDPEDPGDPGDPPVSGLSFTGNAGVGFSDIMFLSGILCLLLYVKSKIAVSANLRPYSRRKSR